MHTAGEARRVEWSSLASGSLVCGHLNALMRPVPGTVLALWQDLRLDTTEQLMLRASGRFSQRCEVKAKRTTLSV
jgi:hypothetical protein